MIISDVVKTYKGLPRSVYVIFFARVVNCIGNFVFPFMTLLLTTKVGMSEEEVGFFLLLGSFVHIPGSLLGGKLTDHMGRKKIMITFMTLASLCFVPCAFLVDTPGISWTIPLVDITIPLIPSLLILSSFLSSIGGPSGGAMMNDLTKPENRQAAFSLLYLGINVGTAIGSIVAGILFNNYMKLLFLGDTATTMIAVILLAKFVTETKPTKEAIESGLNEDTDEKAEKGGMIAALLRRPVLLIFAVLDTIYSFVYAQTHFSLPLQAQAVFGVDLGPKYFGTFNMINCLMVIFFTTLITAITRRIRPIFNVSISGLFFAVGFGMLFFVKSFWLFALSTVVWTVGEILNATNVGVFIANHTPMSHRGRFNSIINIISGTGGAVSPYIMGGFIAANGVDNVWPIIFIMSVSASFFIFILGASERRKETRAEFQQAQ